MSTAQLPLYPARLWGSERTVASIRKKCWSTKCLTVTGTMYGPRYVCHADAWAQHAIERAAGDTRTVAR